MGIEQATQAVPIATLRFDQDVMWVDFSFDVQPGVRPMMVINPKEFFEVEDPTSLRISELEAFLTGVCEQYLTCAGKPHGTIRVDISQEPFRESYLSVYRGYSC